MTGNIFSKHTTQLLELVKEHAREVGDLARRYDDALKRMNDMQAELEFLRAELGRKA